MPSPRTYIGTSGWAYGDWAGVFYPRGLKVAERLGYYMTRFNALEINASYYRLPSASTISMWDKVMAPEFGLVLKGSQLVTHRLRLSDVADALREFTQRVAPLRALKVLLWQLPPGLKRDLGRLEAFLAQLPRNVRHAIEFRDVSWWCDAAAELLARYNAAFVAVSHPSLPRTVIPTADFLYVRFHGLGERLYYYDYADAELEPWAEALKPYVGKRDTFIFFNNGYHAHAVKNALTFSGDIIDHSKLLK